MLDEYNTMPVMVALLDTRGRIQFVNTYFEQLSGYRLQEIRGKDWFAALFPAGDYQRLREEFRHSTQKISARGKSHAIVTRGGEEIEIEWSDQAVRDAEERVVSILVIGQKASDRRALARALRENERRLNEAQHLAGVGSWELNLARNELVWSDEIFHLFEIDKNQFGATYESFLNVVHPEDRDKVNRAYSLSLEDKTAYEITHRLLMADGRVKWVHERCISEFDADGRPIRSVGTVQDISERQLARIELERLNAELEQRVGQRTAELVKAKNEAEQASRAKSEFLSRMSHELRTPMNGIMGFAQLLSSNSKNALDGEQADYVQEILSSGKHLLGLINEVLDLARIERGEFELLAEPIAISRLLQECASSIQAPRDSSRLELKLNLCGDYLVHADPLRLRQIVSSLLSNAVWHNPVGDTIEVSCGVWRDGRVRISVSDKGRGIATGTLDDMFKPFACPPSYDGFDGGGIGLALSKKIAEAMGGEMGAESIAGKGSMFWVELPVADGHHLLSPPDVTAKEEAAQQSGKVLYIENSLLSVRLVRKSIADHLGLSLLNAPSAELGLEMARSHLPDIILLDINLPGMNGFEALVQLQKDKRTSAIPVVALTANGMERDIRRGLEAGFVDYLTKPLDIVQLVIVVGKHIHNRVI